MPWNVNDAELEVAEIEGGEADVDGDAALLLLRQAVTVNACQGLDQCGLAMVDVAGSTQNQVVGHRCLEAPQPPAALGRRCNADGRKKRRRD